MPDQVLVVDDDQTNRDFLEAVLLEDGFAVAHAPDGETAIDRARNLRPALILLDLMMPGMSGFDVLRDLKADFQTRETPVIVITAAGHLSAKEKALIGGGDEFLRKPVEPMDLRARIASLLRVRRASRPLERTLGYLQNRERLRATEHSRERDASEGRVLVVSEAIAVRDTLAAQLQDHGLQVLWARTGAEGIRLYAARAPGLVLLDVDLTRDWLEALQHFRGLEPLLPILALTEDPHAPCTLAALKTGAVDVVVKGWDSTAIALTLHRAVRQRFQLERVQAEAQGPRAALVEASPRKDALPDLDPPALPRPALKPAAPVDPALLPALFLAAARYEDAMDLTRYCRSAGRPGNGQA